MGKPPFGHGLKGIRFLEGCNRDCEMGLEVAGGRKLSLEKVRIEAESSEETRLLSIMQRFTREPKTEERD